MRPGPLLFVRLDVQFDLNVISHDLGSLDDFTPGETELAALESGCPIPTADDRSLLQPGPFPDQLNFQFSMINLY